MRPSRRTRYARAHDLEGWKTDERAAATGFAHRWESVVADGNGEDFFVRLLDQHVRDDLDVLDLGCGHGALTLAVARRVRSVVGLDRHHGYLQLAGELLSTSGLTNASFIETELADPGEAHRGGPLPLRDRSIDLIIGRRGPPLVRYLADLRRVARPGAVIIGMHPAGTAPPPSWASSMPSLHDRFISLGYADVAGWVTGPLAGHGITDYRLWWLDVPEYLYSARSVYDRLVGDGAPPWDSVAAEIEAAFELNQADGAVSLRHIRLVWTVRMP